MDQTTGHLEFFDRIGLDAREEEFCAYISMGATFKTTISSPATAMTNPAAENVDSLSPSSLYLSITMKQLILIYVSC
jgi:hypothetical protein